MVCNNIRHSVLRVSGGTYEKNVCWLCWELLGSFRSLLSLFVLLCPHAPAHAENVAPSVHWGALDFPDRERTVTAGLTINRFTEFDVHRNRFNAITQSAGFNFVTVSVTDRIPSFPAWSGNVTWGAGPTSEAPSRNLQSFVHHLSNQGMVPTDQARDSTDFMISGSVTRWSQLFSSRDTGFLSFGVTGGSLYQEAYGRLGIRECSVADLAAWVFPGKASDMLKNISRYVRFSAMGRYSRLYEGAAYSSDVLANQSYLGQASVSLADFGEGGGESGVGSSGHLRCRTVCCTEHAQDSPPVWIHFAACSVWNSGAVG